MQSGLRGDVGSNTRSWQVTRTLSLHSELGVCEGSWEGGGQEGSVRHAELDCEGF